MAAADTSLGLGVGLAVWCLAVGSWVACLFLQPGRQRQKRD